MKDYINLYGIEVYAGKYETVKRMADLIARRSYVDIPLKQAQKQAVRIALEAMDDMENWCSKQLSAIPQKETK